jgi:hypothetical protein
MPDSETPGFEKDIKPLFRSKDRESMKNAFNLWSFEDVVKHATSILEAVAAPQIGRGSFPNRT